MSKTSSAVKRRYNVKAYDVIQISVPKGTKKEIKAYADSIGESVNGLIKRLLAEEMSGKGVKKDDGNGIRSNSDVQ